jgi:hypothetical protein
VSQNITRRIYCSEGTPSSIEERSVKIMASSCFSNRCGCEGNRNGYNSPCDNGGSVDTCGRRHVNCGNHSQNLLGCACGGITSTVYKVINGLDNTLCGCSLRR